MSAPDRALLEDLLRSWAAGTLSEREVHSRAEMLFAEWGSPTFSRDDPRSIPAEVASQLDILNHQWIFEDDIPAMLALLGTAPGDEVVAWQRWDEYWDGIDFAERERKLAGRIYYVPRGRG